MSLASSVASGAEDFGFQANGLKMCGSLLGSCGIDASNEFSVLLQVLVHPGMLPTYGAVHDYGARSLSDGAGGAHRHCAVDNRQRGPEESNVAGRFFDEVFDLERIADMQNIRLLDPLGGCDIHPDHVIVFGSEIVKGLAHLSEPGNDNLASLFHRLLISS